MKMAMNISPSTDHSITLHNNYSVYYLHSLEALENEERESKSSKSFNEELRPTSLPVNCCVEKLTPHVRWKCYTLNVKHKQPWTSWILGSCGNDYEEYIFWAVTQSTLERSPMFQSNTMPSPSWLKSMSSNKPAGIKRPYISLKRWALSEVHGVRTQTPITLHSHKVFKWDRELKPFHKCLKMINWRTKSLINVKQNLIIQGEVLNLL